jgi:hypothetical protein
MDPPKRDRKQTIVLIFIVVIVVIARMFKERNGDNMDGEVTDEEREMLRSLCSSDVLSSESLLSLLGAEHGLTMDLVGECAEWFNTID